MRKSIVVKSTLSPYAKALKHVAVRGATAVGPSARDQEMKMYTAGTLPADYKPPVQGQWDDTVERWAYAWQYPSLEEAEETDAYRISNDAHLIGTLKDFAGFLEANPISTPSSNTTSTAVPKPVGDLAQVEEKADEALQAIGGNAINTLSMLEEEDVEAAAVLKMFTGGHEYKSSSSNLDVAQKNNIAVREDDFLAELDAASRSVGGEGASVTLRDETTGELKTEKSELLRVAAIEPLKTNAEDVPAGIPAAYIYDGSFLSKLSIRFGQIVVDQLSLSYDEEGITTVLQALAYAEEPQVARQLFNLVTALGFAINANMFNALLYVDAQLGNVNPVMKGIEEMKSCGITPVRNTWHLLMLSFSKAGDYGAVMQVCDNMKSYANIEPDETTFALQLYALALDRSKENNVAEAIQLFDEMENVYGYVAGRPHYHALMKALASKKLPAMRERLELLGTKMEMLGIPWNSTTYTIQMRCAHMWGDTERIKKLFAKLRDDGLPATPSMYAWAIRSHAIAMRSVNYDLEFRNKNKSPIPYWVDQLTMCYSLFELLVKRNEEITGQLIDSLLFSVGSALMLAMEHTPDDTETIMRFEQQATQLWDTEYDKHGLEKSVFSYHSYISVLAHQQRIDEAEKLFQDIVLTHDKTPLGSTYEVLMFMHLASGEEGGTARALQYMEAMERSKMPIKASLLKRFVAANNDAGYKRDMKRRARRIMQAREEYMARQQEKSPFEEMVNNNDGGFAAEQSPSSSAASKSSFSEFARDDNEDVISPLAPNPTTNAYRPDFVAEETPSQRLEEAMSLRSENALKPLPISPNSTLAWWHKWRKESISKHELFPVEGEDGMPRGETDSDRQLALRSMGIAPMPKEEMPDSRKHQLLPKLRNSEGEVAGALWAMDGGELSYPKDGSGPESWGVQLWRERKLLQKEFTAITEGRGGELAEFSDLGVGSRVANDQLAIQEAGLKNPGELADYRQYPHHVYDDGTLKPASEMEHYVPPSAELVWKQEAADPLSPFKSQDELSLEAENTFFSEVQLGTKSKIKDAIAAIRAKEEHDLEVVGRTLSKRGKHDYLSKWREMYSHGTLEVPDEPITQFGRTIPVGGAGGDISQSIRGWYKRNNKTPQLGNLPAGDVAATGAPIDLTGAVLERNEQMARREAERTIGQASAKAVLDKKRFRSKGRK